MGKSYCPSTYRNHSNKEFKMVKKNKGGFGSFILLMEMFI